MKIVTSEKSIARALFVILVCYSDILGKLPEIVNISLYIAPIILLLFENKYKISKDSKIWLIIFLACFEILPRNMEMMRGNYGTTLKWFIRFFFIFLDAKIDRTAVNDYVYLVPRIGCLSVVFTLLFWLFPSLYSLMFRLWGDWPKGVHSLREGYKAGLTTHYSHNGTAIAFIVLSLFSVSFDIVDFEKKNRKNKVKLYVYLFLCIFALVLTSKRAHLIFCIMTMVFIYYYCNPKKIVNRTFGIIVFALLLLIVGIALVYINPRFNALFSRFETLGTDRQSESRVEFWMVALQLWEKNPIFGIGWFGFRNQFSTFFVHNSNDYLNAHNVYIQLLCETGIGGLSIYLSIVSYVIIKTLGMLRKTYKYESCKCYRNLLMCSSTYQMFYLLYSLSGNCLYDITFGYYCMAASISLSMSHQSCFRVK